MSSKVTINRKPLDRLLAGTGGALDHLREKTAERIATGMRNRVHVVSGRTLASIEAHKDGTVTAEYGAYWEWLKGGSHNFIDKSVEEGLRWAGDEIGNELRRITS